MGAWYSLILLVLLLYFAILKAKDLVGNDANTIKDLESQEFFAPTDSFGAEDGFAIAAGLIQWD